MIKLLYNLLFKRLNEYHIAQIPRDGFEKLVYRFSDSKGRKYYGFPENNILPLERFSKLQEYVMYMSAGLSADNMGKLLDEGLEAVHEGLKNPSAAAKVAAIMKQLRQREELFIPFQLNLNYICIQLVREDESIDEYNDAIHQQKVEYFYEHYKDHSFFFQVPELKRLQTLLSIPTEKLGEYFEQSIVQEKVDKQSLKIYSSSSLSSRHETGSASS